MAKIGLALSGGGHRASVFAIGVLMYLVDAKKNSAVNGIASVSGGSLTNGYLAQWGGFSNCNSAGFDGAMRELSARLAQHGTLWGWRPMRLYLGLTVACLLGSAGTLFLGLPAWLRSLACLAGLLVTGKLFEKRGDLCGQAYAATLYSPKGRPTTLKETASPTIDHVYCATDLHAGEHVYFSADFVYSYRFGWGQPAELPLHVAVQASSAFPGGFPAGWLRTQPFGFQKSVQKDAPWMALIDGGVYDNMGEQWFTGMKSRKERIRPLADALKESDELIVVNSSANIPWSPLGKLRIPLLGELLTLLRVMLVLHDNTTTTRRQLLVELFTKTTTGAGGPLGAFVTIEQTPHKVAKGILRMKPEPWWNQSAKTTLADRQKRAQDVLNLLGEDTEAGWKEVSDKNSLVPTTLRALGAEPSVRLVHQAYVVAMCNLHVLLDYPLEKLPTPEEIQRRLGL